MNTAIVQLADWMITTRRGGLCLWLLERIAFAIGALLTMIIIFLVETRMFPVVTNWSVEYITKKDNIYTVGGVLNKARPCELIATTVMAIPKNGHAPRTTVYQLKPADILGGNVPTGISEWGPWEVPIPKKLIEHRKEIDRLEVIGTHRCHMAWSQETLYGVVPMSRLPD